MYMELEVLILYFKNLVFLFLIDFNCENLAKQLLPFAMFYNLYLSELFFVWFVQHDILSHG